jgi:hypothetical protein
MLRLLEKVIRRALGRAEALLILAREKGDRVMGTGLIQLLQDLQTATTLEGQMKAVIQAQATKIAALQAAAGNTDNDADVAAADATLQAVIADMQTTVAGQAEATK